MGDRANIIVTEDCKTGVVLYTHWRGSELPEILKTALDKKWRWTDTSYLTRIIFCEMVKGDEASETGFGISTQLGDNGHPYLVVDTERQVVVEVDADYGESGLKQVLKQAKILPGVPFAKYRGVWHDSSDPWGN
jgi:hypothetical protein